MTGPLDDDPDYEVGYRKPPKHSRFARGRSGNPKGRPKGTKNLKTDLAEVLAEKILVREGDNTRLVSKQRAMLITLVNRVLRGDAKAANVVLSRIERHLESENSADPYPTTWVDLMRLAGSEKESEESE